MGYLAVYREYNDRPCARLRLWDLAGVDIRCEAITKNGADCIGADAVHTVSEDGGLDFCLPAPFTYALYRYRVLGGR